MQELRLLAEEAEELSESQFLRRLSGTFLRLRDRHTIFENLALSASVATLPFRVERCFEGGNEVYLVTATLGPVPDPDFKKGVEVTHWNGIPIRRAVEINGELLPGANPAAMRALGERFLTQRPLRRFLPPDEEWVRVTFRGSSGLTSADFTWSGVQLDPEAALPPASPANLLGRGLDELLDISNRAQRVLFAPASFDLSPKTEAAEAPILDVFQFSEVDTQSGVFGYIRISSFGVDDAQVFLADFIRILQQLPAAGLIIDIRDNPGGYIAAGQMILQTLTEKHISPGRFHLRNTPLLRRMCERNELVLGPWQRSQNLSVGTGAIYSQGFPIEGVESDYNQVGRKYQGPVVLITSALSYSTSDIFAADFIDHRIGKVLGIDENMGAGGANNWPHWLLRLASPGFSVDPVLIADLDGGTTTEAVSAALESHGVFLSPAATAITPVPQSWGKEWRLKDSRKVIIFRYADWLHPDVGVYFDGDGSALQDLHPSVNVGVSFRMSTRTHADSGLPLEDIGIQPDEIHQMTRNDLLSKNGDLIEHAARILKAMSGSPPA